MSALARLRRSPILHIALLAATLLTTTAAGCMWIGLHPTLHHLRRGLPFSTTLLAILIVHESGHYLMCRRYAVDASLPYFVPAPPQIFWFGTFGAFIRIRSRFPDRRALFDIGAGGPWAGFVVALGALVVGLRLSSVVPVPPTTGGLEFGDSLLTKLLARLVLHADSDTVLLHPVALAGWFGLFVTSLNLLPVGQLDGGHVLYAAAGRRTRLVPAVVIGTLVWLGIRVWPGWLVWAMISVLMLRLGHPPTLDDGTPLDPGRRLAAVLSIALLVLTFVPEPMKWIP
jgi:membrane-associated protease RseP (regulator of RpoE activity)